MRKDGDLLIEQLLLDYHSRGKLAVYGQLLTLSP